ncbi:hypothetical protein MUK42_18626 [Musa troglodytarum]|uniref:Uncharacterized protein n=1 Tax=Musa troglodytarum TaxID=320322 RepID=A0A9E7ESL7_9LILI|nr:hypothetical protein MUK42_18626 [Musa troglodytarum]
MGLLLHRMDIIMRLLTYRLDIITGMLTHLLNSTARDEQHKVIAIMRLCCFAGNRQSDSPKKTTDKEDKRSLESQPAADVKLPAKKKKTVRFDLPPTVMGEAENNSDMPIYDDSF